MKRIAVLGAGLVGSLIARELAADGRYDVTAVDRSEEALGALAGRGRLTTTRADLSSPGEIVRAVANADVVAGAVPGFLGTAMLKAVLAAKKPIADISFAPEDPLLLDGEARRAGVPAVVDCGVSPGLSNLAAGRAESLLEKTDSIRILVGGLPVRRVKPFEYRIVFSATDVIEEYTRPARLRENGRLVTKPALSDVEEIVFPSVGTLEAFLTDGLRTLLATSKAPDICEKTLRYPGHAAAMRLLRDAGFFGETPIEVEGMRVRPRAVSERLLFADWRLPPGEEEITLLRVVVEGERGGRRERRTFELFDRTDPKTGETSMARTTGIPCVIVARLLADGAFGTPGIHPPEVLGKSTETYGAILKGLSERGIRLAETAEEVPAA